MTRLHVNINDETADAIREMQEKRQTTATEVIRRAVSAYYFLAQAQDDGKRIETVDYDGTTTRWIML